MGSMLILMKQKYDELHYFGTLSLSNYCLKFSLHIIEPLLSSEELFGSAVAVVTVILDVGVTELLDAPTP